MQVEKKLNDLGMDTELSEARRAWKVVTDQQ